MGLLHGLGLLVLAPAFDLLLQPCNANSRRDHLVEFLALVVVSLAEWMAKHLAEPGDHARIDRIILGQLPRRLGEVTHSIGIDDHHFHTGPAQQCSPAPLVTAAGLHHRFVNFMLFQPCQQLATALSAVGKGRFRAKPDRRIDLPFGNIDADKCPLLCHPPAPFLARAGSRPMQLFGFRKTPDLSLAPLQASCLRDRRAQIWRRAAVGSSRPFAHSDKIDGHKRPCLYK
jgi:hypothetical protein